MWRDELTRRLGVLEHPAWGPEHSRRLYHECVAICEADGLEVDYDVLHAAAWLHDIGTFPQFATGCEKPQECAAVAAEKMLAEVGFPPEKIPEVVRIIREHSFEGATRDTEEARVLRDADMLEFLGAIGVTRVLSLVDVEDWVPDVRTAIDLALGFARELPGKMLHHAARVVADERVAETLDFVGELSAETAALEAL